MSWLKWIAMAVLVTFVAVGGALVNPAWGKDRTRSVRRQPKAARPVQQMPAMEQGIIGVIAFYDATTASALSTGTTNNPMSALFNASIPELARVASLQNVQANFRSMHAWRANLPDKSGWAVPCGLEAPYECALTKMQQEGYSRVLIVTLATQPAQPSGSSVRATVALANRTGYEVHPIVIEGRLDWAHSDFPDFMRYVMTSVVRMVLMPPERRVTSVNPWVHFDVQRDRVSGEMRGMVYFEQPGRHGPNGALLEQPATRAEWTDYEAEVGDYRIVSLARDLKRCDVRRKRLKANFFWALRVNPIRPGETFCAADLLPELRAPGEPAPPARAQRAASPVRAPAARPVAGRVPSLSAHKRPWIEQSPWRSAGLATTIAGVLFTAAGGTVLDYGNEVVSGADPQVHGLNPAARMKEGGEKTQKIGGAMLGVGLAAIAGGALMMLLPDGDSAPVGSSLESAAGSAKASGVLGGLDFGLTDDGLGAAVRLGGSF